MIGAKVSHYKIVDKLGAGGMAEVYLAEDSRLGRRVALKILPPEMASSEERLARFQREARTLAALDHPSIVQIYSVERSGDLHFLTMQLVDGARLSEHIPEEGMSLERFFEIAIPLADALRAAHEKGVTHRDLKPANVMVDGAGRARILDFGLAKLESAGLEESEASTELATEAGAVMGTVPYMSPEQLQGIPVDHRTDLFSMGVLFYEMLAGRRPFQGGSSAAVISSILRDAPPGLAEVRAGTPAELARIVSRCLEKEPARRYPTAAALRDDLDAASQAEGRAEPSVSSIAVLPFADMTSEGDQGYFCDGIAEEILNSLTRVSDLRVAARTSSFLFRDRAADIREIGRNLNVATILEGSVRKAGSRVRISAQLINVADGYHLWSDRYDRELTDIFAIQDEISGSIVRALEVTLSPEEKRSLDVRPRASIEAYEYYLRGRHYLNKASREDSEFALQMFRQATEIDSEYALACSGISECHAILYHWYGRLDADLAEAERVGQRAVELAPELAEAHSAHALALSLQGRSDEAHAAFERAIELNPNLFEAHYYFARDRMMIGDWQRAAGLIERAAVIRPEDYQALLLAPQVYRSLGRPEMALEASRQGLARARRHVALHPEDARAHSLAAGALVALGRREEGLASIERALELQPDNSVHLYNAACVYSRTGDLDRALDLLERVLAAGSGSREWFENDSDLDNVRADPRFGKLMDETDWSNREST